MSGAVWLLGLNALNPEAFVVRENLDRTDYADATYLSQLSDDATPAILAGIDRLPTEEADWLVQHLCDATGSEPVLGNLAGHRAADVLDDSC